MQQPEILLTGGAGYIGSHIAVELYQRGFTPVIVDNFSNSSPAMLERIAQITGHKPRCYTANVRDQKALAAIFSAHSFQAVIHLAGLKAVGESVEQPLHYYTENLESTLSLLQTMQDFQVPHIIFSSSATVYGTPEELPLTENSPVGRTLTNPYGRTKYMIEEILRDATVANPDLQVTILRYANPVGAHASGLIGENPQGRPNNLLPFVAKVATGSLPELGVFGDDYDTPDGTGVRDYIHVVDLATGHIAALEATDFTGHRVYNLGTGSGSSVLEVVKAFEKAAGKPIPYTIHPRRSGDIASCYLDPTKAAQELGWKASLTIDDACRDAWNWQHQNPNGVQ